MRSGRHLALAVLAAPFALALTVAASTSAATPPTEPDDRLAQTIDAGQAIATGPAELSSGHVDIGPHLDGDDWTLMVHDDGVVPAVWRSFDDAVLRVHDTALLTVPDDPAYAFLGVEPGTAVHVVPQIQNPEVVWVGWNTQEPNVLAAIHRGVTLTLLGVQGPGTTTVYLQAGNLAEPDVLWQSTNPEPQPLWVEVNTHTHANWVFSEPGVYLVQVEASADLIDGRRVSDVATLRFAIGDAASADEARQALLAAPAPTTRDDELDDTAGEEAELDDAAGNEGARDEGAGNESLVVVIVVAAGAVLAAGVVVVVVRGGRAKQRAEAERAAARSRDGVDS